MRQGARKIDNATVNGLMESIKVIGIFNPLRVRAARKMVMGVEADAYEVIAGGHRLRAASKLGLETVPCTVVNDDDLHAELAAIDENLCRADLSPAQRATATARRKQIYEDLHPETVHGGNQQGPSGQFGHTEAERFTGETAKATGKSERAVRRDADRGKNVAPDVLDTVIGTHLDKGAFLDDLKKLPPDEQRSKVARALASEERERKQKRKDNKAKSNSKDRAARTIADIIIEYVPADIVKSMTDVLNGAGAKSIAAALMSLLAEAA
jgi:ParB-like chromosome segregation protein Spo0J